MGISRDMPLPREQDIECTAKRLLDCGVGVPQHSCSNGLGRWLSAALSDPGACDEFKSDITDWFRLCEELSEALEE